MSLLFISLSLFCRLCGSGRDLVTGCDYLLTEARETVLREIKNAIKNRKQKKSKIKFVYLKEHGIADL